MTADGFQCLLTPAGHRLAYAQSPGAGPGVVWLGGFRSDMTGSKATFLHQALAEAGRGFLRFDYFGHGASEGAFEDGTISIWREDALAVLDALCDGPQILVGSSMGAWIALLAALARPETVKALVLIAPAPDFTETLMWARFSPQVKSEILQTGAWLRPSDYDPAGYPITRALIEDGRRHLLLGRPIPIAAPVRILQGAADEDVPMAHALRLLDDLTSEDVIATVIKGGDHRLSAPADLERLRDTVLSLV
ncbi:MAG: alpha/beta hydrolase [Maricaulaceae bacterium]